MATCKHIIHLTEFFREDDAFSERIDAERFPFINIYWDSITNSPKLFNERPHEEIEDILETLGEYFDLEGTYKKRLLTEIQYLFFKIYENKRVKIENIVLEKLDEVLQEQNLIQLSQQPFPNTDFLKTQLYPYQQKGVEFGLYRKAVLIGDEMGLGKTIQAITLAILKRQILGFEKVLIVTLASLKEQWKREIEKFTDEIATVVMGSPVSRQEAYNQTDSLFKVTNYEAVRKDVALLTSFNPDLVILDEAQRIKNFETKTADAVKRIPKKHGIVLTGTPLENKLEDVYSIIQFLDSDYLAPLWRFAGDYFMLSREKKGKILGYRNLDQLHEKLKPIVIRRKKEDVLTDLPEQVNNDYFVDLNYQQQEIHNSFAASLAPILHKKFLTPMDLQKIQRLLLMMRMSCNSTYLIDRETNISPKLKELESILDDLVVQNERKVVIFSEWTTMTFLIAKHLSKAKIDFVELTGKIPVHKRQPLIDEFTNNPDCKVFLASDAGGTGLNLQAADCVINFELPWNPAKINQRIGRVNRIGQKNDTINVINLIAKNSIEERILAGLQIKTDLFQGVFDGTTDTVEFSQEKRQELLNKLKGMIDGEQFNTTPEDNRSEEIPQDTPHFLNPEVLKEKENTIGYDAEEGSELIKQTTSTQEESTELASTGGAQNRLFEGQPVEKVEEVLNNGMSFISGLLEMATGQKIEQSDDNSKMISINKDSGEVTMKFKLPGC
ncbi:MAG: DEAD/DEAH box helicase [Proteobacteria bacterium]|nr:DEAD/DEAH box helicase [Pseudomonadota bacterium]